MFGQQLRGHVQHYAWGKSMPSSLVAEIAGATDDSLPYAELWMGAHPKGMSRLKGTDQTLASFLKENASWLGPSEELPFLLKILSVNQALSIQAHPTKQLAEQLARTNPEVYDCNHKPEIALPIGPFEALCAFRPVREVHQFVEAIPELRDLCGDPTELKEMYGRLMNASQTIVAEKVDALTRRIRLKTERLTQEEELVLRLSEQFPGDIGIFSVFFLNYVRIDKPHQFMYCKANVPHAYLSGDCIECMALSDNVVRAGLTPKFKDTDLLLSMLSYEDDLLPQLVSAGEDIGCGAYLYRPPVDDFMLYELTEAFTLPLPRATIVLCMRAADIVLRRGDATESYSLDRGDILLTHADTSLELLNAGHVYIATQAN